MIPVRNIAHNMIHAASRMSFRAFKHAGSEFQSEVESVAESPRDAAHFVFTTDGDLIPCDEKGHLLAELDEEPSQSTSEEHKTPAA